MERRGGGGQWRLKSFNSWGCGILSAPHRTVRASRTCKSGLNNAARETNILLLGAAESLPLLNEEFAKSLFCGGKDSSAPISNLRLHIHLHLFSPPSQLRSQFQATKLPTPPYASSYTTFERFEHFDRSEQKATYQSNSWCVVKMCSNRSSRIV